MWKFPLKMKNATKKHHNRQTYGINPQNKCMTKKYTKIKSERKRNHWIFTWSVSSISSTKCTENFESQNLQFWRVFVTSEFLIGTKKPTSDNIHTEIVRLSITENRAIRFELSRRAEISALVELQRKQGNFRSKIEIQPARNTREQRIAKTSYTNISSD